METIKERVQKQMFSVASDAKITFPNGFVAAGMHAGIKRKRPDLGLLVCEVPASVAAVYTTNAFQAAPLKVTQESLGAGRRIQAIVVNSGIANACTGRKGLEDAYQMRKKTADLLGIPEHFVAVASTGVIGEYLPMERVEQGLDQLVPRLQKGDDKFAQAILTTDTCTKQVAVELQIDGKCVRIAGVAKGSGMIKPNMATMLGFLAFDAAVAQPVLDTLVKEVADRSFNCITIDGDTSTNDSFMLIASGKSTLPAITSTDSPAYAALRDAVTALAQALSQLIVRDGEGATKFITVQVEGGRSVAECRQIAYAIGHSPLVKTAFYASDPNLGRILAAIGYAGVADLDVDKIDLYLDDVLVAKAGGRNPAYLEEDGQRVMKQSEITIRVLLGRGDAQATIWTCDLSHDYVSINADYRS